LQEALTRVEHVLRDLVRKEAPSTHTPRVTFSLGDDRAHLGDGEECRPDSKDLATCGEIVTSSIVSSSKDSIAQPPQSQSEVIPLPGSMPQALSGPQGRLLVDDRVGRQISSDSKLGRQTSQDSRAFSGFSSFGQQRQASVDSAASSQQATAKFMRQVSWMAERSRNITQAMSLDDSDADIPKFQAHDVWQEKDDAASYRSSRRPSVCTTNLLLLSRHKSSLSPLVLEGWSAIAMSMIFMEGFRIPLLAFPGDTLAVMDLLVLIFWLSSVLGADLMRRGQPRSTRFLAWLSLETLFAASTAYMLVASTVPFAVLLRGLPLLRILYIHVLWDFLSARHLRPWIQRRSLEARFFGNLLLAVLTGALLLHIVTCMWYAIGDRPSGWVRDQDLESVPQSVQYRIAAEWALSRLPPSRIPDNMLLNTLEERGVAVLVTTLFASMFTSIVTNDMSDIRRARAAQRKSHDQLSKYLATYPVPWDLEKELQAYLHRNQSLVQPPQKREMAFLLPAFLYRELCREALSPVIAKHDFFSGLRGRYPSFHMDLCVECLSEWHLASEEFLFSNGPLCHHMMFVASGEVAYRKLSSEFASSPLSARNEVLQQIKGLSVVPTAASATIVEEKLGFGDWMCEQCLWTKWHFLGTAVSTQGATVICLADETLMKYADLHKEVMAELLVYCRIFVEVLNGVADDDLSDLSIGALTGAVWPERLKNDFPDLLIARQQSRGHRQRPVFPLTAIEVLVTGRHARPGISHQGRRQEGHSGQRCGFAAAKQLFVNGRGILRFPAVLFCDLWLPSSDQQPKV
ncbi:unnamed protein product, partial [Symbiodinium microadriaticum]